MNDPVFTYWLGKGITLLFASILFFVYSKHREKSFLFGAIGILALLVLSMFVTAPVKAAAPKSVEESRTGLIPLEDAQLMFILGEDWIWLFNGQLLVCTQRKKCEKEVDRPYPAYGWADIREWKIPAHEISGIQWHYSSSSYRYLHVYWRKK